MTLFKAFPKIGQYRNAIQDLIYLRNNKNIKDVHLFHGMVKLHGTNAGIGFDFETDQIWFQKRTQRITTQNDNFGFANTFQPLEALLRESFKKLNKGLNLKSILIYGEWAGGNIQKNVALCSTEKQFYPFAVRLENSEGESEMFPIKLFNYITLDVLPIVFNNVPHINLLLPTVEYSVEVDLNNPQKVVPVMERIVEQVEKCCPVGRLQGVDGTGEGVVWYNFETKIMFKTKGQKHSVSKVKKLISVDPEVLESIDNFVEYAVTENRLEQGLEQVGLDQKLIGKFIGWVNKDIHQEESDTLQSNNLTMKDVGKQCSNIARKWYLNKLNNNF